MSTVVSNNTQKISGLANKIFNVRTIPMLATIFVCLALYIVARATSPSFGSAYVFINLFVDNAALGIVAVGMTMVIVSGGIDLSVAGVVALCACVIAKLMGAYHLHPVICWVIALCIGTGMGFLTGCVVRYFKIEPFIATLAGLFLARGIAYMISNETAIPIEHPFMTRMTEIGLPIKFGFSAVTHFCGFRWDPLWIGFPALAVLAVVAIGLYITLFTSHFMGLPVGRTKIRVYALRGFLAALAATVFTVCLLQLVFPIGSYWIGFRWDPIWIGLPALVLLAVVAVGLYITFFTSFGRNLFAVGGNEDAAHLMGLPVGRTKVMVYMLSGFLAALAAIVFTIYLPSGDPTGADGWELNAIAASVIGGTLMTGGAGNVFGTLIGVMILGIIMSSMDFHNVSSYYAKIVIGVLLLVFVVLQRFLSGSSLRKN
ncbi:MAG: hypothetical protein NT018_05650 [Armatimonadetes bacterium]|nr:hypothetical protein [Armatimonadota bacterium]